MLLKAFGMLVLAGVCFAAGYLCRRKNPTDPKVADTVARLRGRGPGGR